MENGGYEGRQRPLFAAGGKRRQSWAVESDGGSESEGLAARPPPRKRKRSLKRPAAASLWGKSTATFCPPAVGVAVGEGSKTLLVRCRLTEERLEQHLNALAIQRRVEKVLFINPLFPSPAMADRLMQAVSSAPRLTSICLSVEAKMREQQNFAAVLTALARGSGLCRYLTHFDCNAYLGVPLRAEEMRTVLEELVVLPDLRDLNISGNELTTADDGLCGFSRLVRLLQRGLVCVSVKDCGLTVAAAALLFWVLNNCHLLRLRQLELGTNRKLAECLLPHVVFGEEVLRRVAHVDAPQWHCTKLTGDYSPPFRSLECWTDASAQIFWLYKLLDILAKGRDFGGAHRMRLLESEVKRRWREEEKEASSLCVDDEADFPRAFCDTCGGELRRQPLVRVWGISPCSHEEEPSCQVPAFRYAMLVGRVGDSCLVRWMDAPVLNELLRKDKLAIDTMRELREAGGAASLAERRNCGKEGLAGGGEESSAKNASWERRAARPTEKQSRACTAQRLEASPSSRRLALLCKCGDKLFHKATAAARRSFLSSSSQEPAAAAASPAEAVLREEFGFFDAVVKTSRVEACAFAFLEDDGPCQGTKVPSPVLSVGQWVEMFLVGDGGLAGSRVGVLLEVFSQKQRSFGRVIFMDMLRRKCRPTGPEFSVSGRELVVAAEFLRPLSFLLPPPSWRLKVLKRVAPPTNCVHLPEYYGVKPDAVDFGATVAYPLPVSQEVIQEIRGAGAGSSAQEGVPSRRGGWDGLALQLGGRNGAQTATREVGEGHELLALGGAERVFEKLFQKAHLNFMTRDLSHPRQLFARFGISFWPSVQNNCSTASTVDAFTPLGFTEQPPPTQASQPRNSNSQQRKAAPQHQTQNFQAQPQRSSSGALSRRQQPLATPTSSEGSASLNSDLTPAGAGDSFTAAKVSVGFPKFQREIRRSLGAERQSVKPAAATKRTAGLASDARLCNSGVRQGSSSYWTAKGAEGESAKAAVRGVSAPPLPVPREGSLSLRGAKAENGVLKRHESCRNLRPRGLSRNPEGGFAGNLQKRGPRATLQKAKPTTDADQRGQPSSSPFSVLGGASSSPSPVSLLKLLRQPLPKNSLFHRERRARCFLAASYKAAPEPPATALLPREPPPSPTPSRDASSSFKSLSKEATKAAPKANPQVFQESPAAKERRPTTYVVLSGSDVSSSEEEAGETPCGSRLARGARRFRPLLARMAARMALWRSVETKKAEEDCPAEHSLAASNPSDASSAASSHSEDDDDHEDQDKDQDEEHGNSDGKSETESERSNSSSSSPERPLEQQHFDDADPFAWCEEDEGGTETEQLPPSDCLVEPALEEATAVYAQFATVLADALTQQPGEAETDAGQDSTGSEGVGEEAALEDLIGRPRQQKQQRREGHEGKERRQKQRQSRAAAPPRATGSHVGGFKEKQTPISTEPARSDASRVEAVSEQRQKAQPDRFRQGASQQHFKAELVASSDQTQIPRELQRGVPRSCPKMEAEWLSAFSVVKREADELVALQRRQKPREPLLLWQRSACNRGHPATAFQLRRSPERLRDLKFVDEERVRELEETFGRSAEGTRRAAAKEPSRAEASLDERVKATKTLKTLSFSSAAAPGGGHDRPSPRPLPKGLLEQQRVGAEESQRPQKGPAPQPCRTEGKTRIGGFAPEASSPSPSPKARWEKAGDKRRASEAPAARLPLLERSPAFRTGRGESATVKGTTPSKRLWTRKERHFESESEEEADFEVVLSEASQDEHDLPLAAASSAPP